MMLCLGVTFDCYLTTILILELYFWCNGWVVTFCFSPKYNTKAFFIISSIANHVLSYYKKSFWPWGQKYRLWWLMDFLMDSFVQIIISYLYFWYNGLVITFCLSPKYNTKTFLSSAVLQIILFPITKYLFDHNNKHIWWLSAV